MASSEERSTRIVVVVAAVMLVALLGAFVSSGGLGGGTGASVTAVDSRGGIDEKLGDSVEGRPIAIVRFGAASRRLLVVGGVHGDEYGRTAADRLLSALRDDPDLLPESVAIDVLPCLSPDGAAAGTRGNARDVDLNRNMPSADWAAQLAPDDPSRVEGLTGGTAAGSEPETQALLRALQSANYAAVVSLHSSGGVVDWDGAAAQPLASRIASASGLPLGNLEYQTSIRGSMGRYLSERGIPLVTIELSSPDFDPGLRDGILRCLVTP
jgi:protein MpaA